MSCRFGVVLPLRVEKHLDSSALAMRFGGVAAQKTLSFNGDRRVSWSRVARLFDCPALPVDKLPARTLRVTRLRLFRAFKLLGTLKERLGVLAADGTLALRSATLLPSLRRHERRKPIESR